jgi:hypothetical protein
LAEYSLVSELCNVVSTMCYCGLALGCGRLPQFASPTDGWRDRPG